MADIMVVVEHRKGQVRDITFEMLQKAGALCKERGCGLTALLLGSGSDGLAADMAKWADTLIVFEDDRLSTYNSDLYVGIIADVMKDRRPFLTLIGHTSWGMDYAPAVSVRTGAPLTTDVSDILLKEGQVQVIRQMYSGKVYAKVSFKPSDGYLATVRPAAFSANLAEERRGEIIQKAVPDGLQPPRRTFTAFEDTAAGDVDITQADLLVSVGRGIGEAENIPVVQELADLLGGTLSCSRPVVDKNWLPKYHQVGTSGKTVKPKVYLALGISGAFQHVAGIAGADCVIAVNKDKKAPIFRVADYGISEDLFKVVEALKEKIKNG